MPWPHLLAKTECKWKERKYDFGRSCSVNHRRTNATQLIRIHIVWPGASGERDCTKALKYYLFYYYHTSYVIYVPMKCKFISRSNPLQAISHAGFVRSISIRNDLCARVGLAKNLLLIVHVIPTIWYEFYYNLLCNRLQVVHFMHDFTIFSFRGRWGTRKVFALHRLDELSTHGGKQ